MRSGISDHEGDHTMVSGDGDPQFRSGLRTILLIALVSGVILGVVSAFVRYFF